MTSFAGAFAAMSAGTSWEEKVSPDTLNDKLEDAYGEMFSQILNSTESFVGILFGGVPPKGWSDDKMTDFVYEFFRDGDWLSSSITKPFMDEYISQVQTKWDEFAVVKAMKSRNKADYFLMVSDHHNGVGTVPTYQDMSEQVCKDHMEGCLWHEKRCICFGSKGNSPGSIGGARNLQGDELKTLKGYVFDYEAALKNNYDCVKYRIDNPQRCVSINGNVPEECNIKDATVPDYNDMDIDNPIQYTKCWFNLPPAMGHDYLCGWTEN
ncbi:fg-gap repeat domain-containing protein [Fusarium globosum]|uniref:Fg-gap repeat domain-containing protein n=1 Tax=Fusarium globosum TaxID=78864 RepID=A0A8H6D192_9HYPO|nr:fg-gap repeat domain-containing protein [Fusarium globosum]